MADLDPASDKKLALLIDADNVRSSFLPIIIREASAIGTIVVRRVYGHFASSTMAPWQSLLHEYALTPVHVPPASRGKNATDMKLAIEAMDLLHQKSLQGICIASSDSDFTTLASRIREDGLEVFGFGEKKTTAPYVAACDRFFYCDLLLDQEKARRSDRPAAARRRSRSTRSNRRSTTPPATTAGRRSAWSATCWSSACRTSTRATSATRSSPTSSPTSSGIEVRRDETPNGPSIMVRVEPVAPPAAAETCDRIRSG